MKANLIKVGNSVGFIISKKILEEVKISHSADIVVQDGKIIISPLKENPRSKWPELLAKANEMPEKLEMDFNNTFDETEWEW